MTAYNFNFKMLYYWWKCRKCRKGDHEWIYPGPGMVDGEDRILTEKCGSTYMYNVEICSMSQSGEAMPCLTCDPHICPLCDKPLSEADLRSYNFYIDAQGHYLHEKCGNKEMRAKGIKV